MSKNKAKPAAPQDNSLPPEADFATPQTSDEISQDNEQDAPVTVEAAVLRDCGFGAGGTVVELPEADAQAAEAHGLLDLHPDAIAFLKQ